MRRSIEIMKFSDRLSVGSRSRFRKTGWAALILAPSVVLSPAHAQQATPPGPIIEWEIENRYRLFRSAAKFQRMAEIFNSLSEDDREKKPAFAFERKMQELAASRKLGNAFAGSYDTERYGWTATLLGPNENCFDAEAGGYFTCRTQIIEQNKKYRKGETRPVPDLFMEPKTTEILVWLKNAESLKGRNCKFSLGTQKHVQRPCWFDMQANGETNIRQRNAAQFIKVPFGEEFTLKVEVLPSPSRLRTPANTTPVVIADVQGTAHHKFIAGFGDSFASGEGNPDKPVDLGRRAHNFAGGSDTTLKHGNDPGQQVVTESSRVYPIRHSYNPTKQFGAPGTSARFLYQQCHRSFSSQHIRATLAIALKQPNTAISFTPYACSGAKTPDIYQTSYEAFPDVHPDIFDNAPQLTRFQRDYCKINTPFRKDSDPKNKHAARADGVQVQIPECSIENRRAHPKAILLSTGGNDIGFAKVVAQLTLTETPLFSDILIKVTEKVTPEQAITAISNTLPGNISTLARHFKKHLGDNAAIIQTGYPSIMDVGNQINSCYSDQRWMAIHRVLKAKGNINGTVSELIDTINDKLSDAVRKLTMPTSSPSWSFVDLNAKQDFKGHSICQNGAPGDPKQNAGKTMPGTLDPITFYRETGSNTFWQPFQPDEWRAYRPRNRWFITPNDAFLTQNYMRISDKLKDIKTRDDKWLPLLAATTGAFHPNNWGHAAMADNVIPVLWKKLWPPSPKP